jgi:hypothetical protein
MFEIWLREIEQDNQLLIGPEAIFVMHTHRYDKFGEFTCDCPPQCRHCGTLCVRNAYMDWVCPERSCFSFEA